MPRTSAVHYIAPSAISIIPNANSSANDLAVYVARGAKIKVYSPRITELGWEDSTFQEWVLSGHNRRLADSAIPYTIYARLPKSDKRNGYLVFAPKDHRNEGWQDKYCYVTQNGLSPLYVSGKGGASVKDDTNWWIKLGEVSLPENNQRTVTLDTGILGTDQYNTDWSLNPDSLPLRIELECSIDGNDAGNRPYVEWGQEMILRARLVAGWTETDVERFDHWEIYRNTGDNNEDARWNEMDRSTGFGQSGNIALSHARGTDDDFNGSVSTTFTIIAMGTNDEGSSSSSGSLSSSSSSSSSSDGLVPIATTTLNVMAETVERYALELSASVASYDPTTDVYSPIDGINICIRATDQKGNVFKLTRGQMESAALAVQYALADVDEWTTMEFAGVATELAESVLDIRVFYAQKNVNVRIVKVVPNSDSDSSSSSSSESTPRLVELYRTPIAFVRNGEDSHEREWIYLRSEGPLTFGEDPEGHLLPALIEGGEVEPAGAASGLDTDKQQDGWVPEGWWDEMQGTNEQYHYEYGAYRDWIRNEASSSSSSSDGSLSDDGEHSGGHWGDFTTPRIWSYYAEDAVTYRCRWTLNGAEVFQLKAAYSGAFRGTLPLVATLMKRVGNAQEQQVTATSSIVNIFFDGLPAESQPSPYNVTNPQFTIGNGEDQHPEFVPFLSNVGLNAINITFNVGDEAHAFSIPVIREADEDSVKDTIDQHGSTLFLSKLHDDIAAGKITFQDIASFLQGLKIGGTGSRYGITGTGSGTFADVIFDSVLKSLDAREGFTDGAGIYMDAVKGLIETDGMNVRGFMRVMELIINRLQLMESDYSFTEGDTADRIDYEDNGQTLLLTMHKDHDTDYTPFYPGDIIYGKVNDLLPEGSPVPDGHTAYKNGSYYTTWMYVKSVDLTANQMRVGIYTGKKQDNTNMVPGGINFSPAGTAIASDVSAPMLEEYTAHGGEGYDTMLTLTRHGNIGDGINPETGEYDESIHQSQLGRQQSWVLSTTDQRLSFLWRVDEPIVADGNYAVCLGMLPDLANLPSTRDRSMPSLYINTLFADNIDQANYPARVVKEDRGQWTDNPTSTYEGEDSGTWTPDGSTYTYGGKTYGNYVKTFGEEGIPQTFATGDTISEPYHYRTFTKALWLAYRLNTSAFGSKTDAELEFQLLTKQPKADLEVSRVWKGGKLWECLVDSAVEEPTLYCTEWQVVGGNSVFAGELQTSNGRTFRNGNVDTILTMHVWWGDEDITDTVFAHQETQVTWTRSTAYDAATEEFVQQSEDKSWSPTVVDVNKIHLVRGDLGSGWMITYRQALFTCRVTFPTGQGDTAEAVSNYIF